MNGPPRCLGRGLAIWIFILLVSENIYLARRFIPNWFAFRTRQAAQMGDSGSRENGYQRPGSGVCWNPLHDNLSSSEDDCAGFETRLERGLLSGHGVEKFAVNVFVNSRSSEILDTAALNRLNWTLGTWGMFEKATIHPVVGDDQKARLRRIVSILDRKRFWYRVSIIESNSRFNFIIEVFSISEMDDYYVGLIFLTPFVGPSNMTFIMAGGPSFIQPSK